MSRQATTVVTLEVKLPVPKGKSAQDIVTFVAATLTRDIGHSTYGEPDHRTDEEIGRAQRFVRLVKKETTYA